MENLWILPFYVVPAGVIVGAAGIVSSVLRRPDIFGVEYVSWLAPGVVWVFLVTLGFTAHEKWLGNLYEPVVIGVICGSFFCVRVAVGIKRPELNKRAAIWCIGLSNATTIVLTFFTPPLPL